MSAARDEILGRIRTALGPGSDAAADALAARLAAHPRHLVPARAQGLDRAQRVALFAALAVAADATVARVAQAADVPAAVAQYLAARNLAARVVMTPDPLLDQCPWPSAPMLAIRRGVAAADDAVGVSAAFAGIAETGTLMLISGPDSPTTNNFLPETHIVVLNEAQIVGIYEDAWDRLRAARMAGGVALPRTINLVTGPSRTGDIAQRLELGAHGPRRLHIVLVEGDDGGAAAER
ncbi:MAG TPA: LUD domain-containing protein [Stellaceae bacterium]|nr:LUD domain-containing protein [Stellaceae bacterium]